MTPHSLIAPGRRIGHAVLRTQSDERLVAMAGAGSEPAFEAIVARYRRPLQRYAASIAGEPRSEDVVQDAIVRAYVALGRGEQVRTLRSWLYRIVHNTALNHLRDRSVADATLDERLPGGEAPHQAVERRQGLSDAVAAVRALPIRQRDAIVLRELEGRSYDEIAGELGVTRGAARQLLSRARTSVRAGVSALIPVGPLMRLAGPLADGPAAARIAELGGGGAVPKLCAVALAAGAIAGGANELPPLRGEAPAPRSPSSQAGGSGGERARTAAARTAAGDSTTPAAARTPSATRNAASLGTGAVERTRASGRQPVGVRPPRVERHRGGDRPAPARRPEPDPARHRLGEPRPAPGPAPGDPRPAPGTPPPPSGPGPGDGQFSTARAPDGGLRLHR